MNFKLLLASFTLLCFTLAVEAQYRDAYFDETSDAELCAKKRCGRTKPKGSMCTVESDSTGRRRARCSCPKHCTNDYTGPVCSIYGREYDNKCLLHKEACRKRRFIKVAYDGHCIASQAKCERDELRQFPFRLLAWFVHLKQNEDFGTIDPSVTLEAMRAEKRQEVANWKFSKLDHDSDNVLTQRELRNFRYSLMPLEHCAKSFFRKCDKNRDSKLQMTEWNECFVSGAWRWYENRDDGIY